MTKVFSPQEVADGMYPKPDAHLAAASLLMKDLAPLEAIYGVSAQVYGSVATSDTDRTSDINLLVRHDLPEDGLINAMMMLGSVVANKHREEQHHVPVSMHLTSASPAAPNSLLRNVLFTEHVMAARQRGAAWQLSPMGEPLEGVLSLSDLSDVSVRHAAALTTAFAYAHQQVACVAQDQAQYPHQPERILGTSFTTAHVLGRQVVRVSQLHAEATGGISVSDTSAALLGKRQAIGGLQHILRRLEGDPTGSVSALSRLASLVTKYRVTLEEAIGRKSAGDSSAVRDYETWLHTHASYAACFSMQVCCGALQYLRSIDYTNKLPASNPAGSP